MRGVMRGRVRGAALGAVGAALVMGVVTGCSAGAGPDPVKNAGGSAAEKDGKAKKDEDKDNDKGGSVGAPGSPCPMPVTFDLVADWKPEAVEPAADDEFAGLLEQGPVSLVCEIDAKPAGNIGFIRVWVGADAGDDTRKVLEAFVADAAADRRKEAYTETKAGTFDATEVSYVNTGEFLDEPRKERAFAVATPKGVVVVDLGGSDSEEHEQMLPAYELARKTLRSS
ncbi:lipoprotein [Streptomyces xantholiticus]